MPVDEQAEYDPFPSLDQAFALRVQEGLDKRFQNGAPQISWENWLKLKPYLAAYKREAEDIQGYLKKGEVRLLRDISKRAEALLLVMQRAGAASLNAPIASVLEPVSIEEFQVLLRRIVEELSFSGKKTTADVTDLSRVNFFANFEAWWMSTTGTPAKIEEGFAGNTHPTPFMWVANEVFHMPGMRATIGASSKALKDLKRGDRKRFATENALAEKLQKLGLLKF